MKGKGTAGSIISTTWEVYNGERYGVDDAFRAYYNVSENWRDHKDLLLTRSWYAPFRAVMTDPVLGAWGLKRSGYATDPQYPVKLISIMRSQDLFKLDEVEL
jgi:flagellum-specific peptidoglycan hydrolase FlgJ